MASQQVINALETLHRELEKLEPAIKHIEMAQLVTETVKTIPQKHLDLIREVKENDSFHKEELKELFIREINSLAAESKKLVKIAEDKLSEIIENDAQYKGELLNIFSKELSEITEENKKLRASTILLQDQVKIEQEALGKLREKIQSFYDRIERINFPERLDKLDATTAGIMAAVQSVQSRLDNLERNITDRLKDAAERQKEAQTATQQAAEAAAKKQQVLTYITWALVIIGIILSIAL